MAGSLPGAAALNPFINFFLLEFPEAADLVGRHMLFAYQLVATIAFDAKISRYFIDRKSPVFHVLIPCALVTENLI